MTIEQFKALVIDVHRQQKDACRRQTGAASATTVVRTILERLKTLEEQS